MWWEIVTTEQKLFFGPTALEVIVTEKVDGANLGISLGKNYEIECFHRGQAITHVTSIEYSKLKYFLEEKQKFLCQILEPQRHVLCGEWWFVTFYCPQPNFFFLCMGYGMSSQVKHSIEYDALPAWLLVFDIYDKYTQTFMSRSKLEEVCRDKFEMTPIITRKVFQDKQELEELLNNTMSTYRKKTPHPIEGLYLKIDDDSKGINLHRCKLVRSEFVQNITEHWMHKKTVISFEIEQTIFFCARKKLKQFVIQNASDYFL
ncbi:DNA ligase III-like protein [Reticulomyxa filosa]|uniref:DNA ligase III-like protein n=1 Tax=Reticulomyxa filosa TaxID=46433 RepID=X6MEX4_RETFI|nr:DNA ligase III-like protein [Reticulomyxa filosa]|eukprot:ETO12573.1 DNA ligase III-like protein [Reticulomyxa filosa]